MIQNKSRQEERYLAAFESFQKNGAARDPLWAHELRKTAMARFNELGFPTARRGNEEWKYTDVAPIARTPFYPITTHEPVRIAAPELDRATFGEPGWPRLAFVDGSHSEEFSSVPSLPAGVTVMSLAEAMATQSDLVEQHLARHASYETNAFTALNTAFVHDGAFVHITDGAHLEEPIHLLFLSTAHQQDAVTHPRVLIITGKDSKATIIESYASLSDGRYFTNGVTEVLVGAGAAVNYYKVQRQSEQALHITNTHVVNSRDSSFSSVNIDLGGRLVRNNLNSLMGDEGGSCMLNGLYMVTGTQHVDNQVIIDHASSYTTARELYKGILDGKSRSVFHGSIIVRSGLRKVDAHQVDKNLLLSDQAEADTKPAFWIYSDDVRCGHGAACGQMDERALFYLRSRGIDEKAARSMLTHAFVSEVIGSIDSETFRTHIDQLVQAKLRDWLGDG